jgi:FxsC-like protein
MAGGVDPHAEEHPLFFLSYAHAHWEDPHDQRDADHWVQKFYTHLCAEIEAISHVPAGHNPVFIDRRLRLGDLWPDELASRLARCAVFVPLYTARYFRRPDCGREWSVIRQREDMHISATGRCPSIVVPVLWQPLELGDIPLWARSIQYSHESLGAAYQTYGLESLLRLRDYRDSYYSAVRVIARRIVEVAHRPERLRALDDAPRFQSLPDAFAAQTTHPDGTARIRITVAALRKNARMPKGRSATWYGESAQEWCPYRDEPEEDGPQTPAAWRAADVAMRRDFEAHVTDLNSRSEELRPAHARPPSAPTVMLVDAWATLDEHWQAMLRRLDIAIQDKPWIRIVLPWNADDPETTESAVLLRSGIERALGRSLSSGRIPSRRGNPGPSSSLAFGPAVSETIRLVQAEFIKNAQKHLPEGPRPKKPRLRGPSGAVPRAPGEEIDD